MTAYLDHKGYACLDADLAAREMLSPGAPEYPDLLQRLQGAFGNDIADEQGVLRRQQLAQRAFFDRRATETLNRITHPALLARVLRAANRAAACGNSLFFLDGAALVGTIFAPYCYKLIVVITQEALRLHRIMQRDHIQEKQAAQRLAVQPTDESLLCAADYVLNNSGDLADLYRQTDAVVCKLTRDIALREKP